MATIDLIYSSPAELAETASLSDLLETVRGIERWEDRHAEVLDAIYRYRLIRLVRLRGSAEDDDKELESFLDHLDRVTHPSRMQALDSLEKRYGSRWLGYLDILEDRLAAVRSPVPEMLMTRAHVPEILDMVADGEPLPLTRIRQSLNLKPNNLTRILDIMEANELIERESVKGREKVARLGMNGIRLLSRRARESAHASGESRTRQASLETGEARSSEPRGALYMTQRAVA